MKSNKIMKLVVTSALVFSMALSLSAVAFAGSYSKTYSGSFASDWSKTVDTNVNGARLVLTYGYNTSFINEDTAYSLYYGAQHRSKIKNGNGTSYGPSVSAYEWSDLEIRHKGSSVTYSCSW